MDITFVTSTNSDDDALSLLKEVGLPFKKNNASETARESQIEKVREEHKREAEEQVKLEDTADENNVLDVEESRIEDSNKDSTAESETTES
jgi:uncharacterized protein YigA (DUF484 family)